MTHRNAVLTPQGRYRLVMRVQTGRPIAHVAAEAGIARAKGCRESRSLPPGLGRPLRTVPAPGFTAPPRPARTMGLIEHWRHSRRRSACHNRPHATRTPAHVTNIMTSYA